MKTLIGLDSLAPPATGSAVTIGTFDGVHLGHRALIAKATAAARADGRAAIAVTWDRHPLQTLRPDRAPKMICTSERKLQLLAEAGLDAVALLPFDRELSRWPPARFAADVLAAGLAARSVFVGQGWRFGRGAEGDVALLQTLGPELGFTAEAVNLELDDGEPVSSSRIRAAVAAGDVEGAARLLGRPFDIDGVVVPGAARGVGLGFPTANLDTDRALAHPGRGVYAGWAKSGDLVRPAAINAGVNPTFGGDPDASPIRIEAYLLDFDGDLYGKTLRVLFHDRLRDELKFESVEDLVEQMRRDVEETRALTC